MFESVKKLLNVNWVYDRLRRRTASTSYIPQIDGLRFLALFLVVIGHIYDLVIARLANPKTASGYLWFNDLFINGRKGVLLFFMISGFILAMPFAKSFWQKEKAVSLKKYYLRRLTRLEPPYMLTMVACFFILLFFGKNGHDYSRQFHNLSFLGLLPNLGVSLLYLHNFFPAIASVNSVTWSLEIEVQFYLLVPLLILILKLPKIYRRLLLVFLTAFFVFLQQRFPINTLSIYSFIQYFLMGFLLVDVYLSQWHIKINRMLSFLAGLFILYIIFYINLYGQPLNEYVFMAVSFCFYILVLKDSLWKKIFSLKLLTTIGGMCYSIYLWHTIIISAAGNRIASFGVFHSYFAAVFWYFLILVPVILLFTTSFYLLIEQPCMDKDWPIKLWSKIKTVLKPKAL
jgi:peptidoglycan/LPS O-acetylase OafA/YrhL